VYWMVGWLPGGSAGTSFCSGTEMSISFRAMVSSGFLIGSDRPHLPNTATARIGDAVPSRHFIGRPIKVKGPWPSSASRLHRLSIWVMSRSRHALSGEPFGRGDIHAGIVGRIFLAREGASVMAGAEQDRAALRHAHACLLHRRLQIGGRNFRAGCNM